MTQPKRPNILILMSDEHRADVAGFAGDPVARTPNLDWLARDGVVFENAYTPSPICVPARQCVFSGQYPPSNGCTGWIGLPPGHMTYASRCGQYGYRTAGFGKMHLVGPDQLAGWQSRPVGDVNYSEVRDPIERFFDGFDAPQDDPLNCPGSMKWSDEKEIRRAGPGSDNPHDVHAVDGALFWIDETLVGSRYDRHIPQRPSLLYVGLHDPHYPYLCREELFRHYLPRVRGYAVEEPFDHPFLGLSPWPPRPLQAGVDVPQRDVQRARAAYYGKVETMDEHFGRVLDGLRAAGQDLDDWIIVYLSDHGDQMGEHGVWEKQKFFEGSARVPLVIRAPKLLPAGSRIAANVNLVDLFASLCELAGMEAPAGLDSRSLVPLMRGEADGWDDETCSFFLQQGFTNIMVKRGHLKYQYYEHDQRGVMAEVLFDLAADPHETRNAIGDPAHAAELPRLRERARQLRQDIRDGHLNSGTAAT
jgi:choline-sulfatase